jgi:hypothetical protein
MPTQHVDNSDSDFEINQFPQPEPERKGMSLYLKNQFLN